MNKITLRLQRSAIGTTPLQRKNLIGLGLIKTGNYSVLNDTASVRGMIKKVIHLVEISKGENVPTNAKSKKGYEVIPGTGETVAKKTKTAKTTAKNRKEKTVKKTVKKAAKK